MKRMFNPAIEIRYMHAPRTWPAGYGVIRMPLIVCVVLKSMASIIGSVARWSCSVYNVVR